MRHELSQLGFAFKLRPVELRDAAELASLRADPSLTRFLHPVPPGVSAQEAWLRAYLERPDDYYFAIVGGREATLEGFLGIYGIVQDVSGQRSGEWGRWILRPGSLAATESALLAYRVAFGAVGLDRVYCHTLAANQSVVSFHDRCNLSQRRVLTAHVELAGERHDVVEHVLFRDDAGRVEAALAPLTQRLARKMGAVRD